MRAGGKLDIEWKDGRLTMLRMQADHPQRYRVVYGSRTAEVNLQPGKPVTMDGMLHGAGR